jgi:co-chaperonin GroES (HSP10)
MRFRPLHDSVVIEGDVAIKGGIIIPDSARERPQEGEIIAAEPGLRDDGSKLNALAVKSGDTVLFGKWSGTDVTIVVGKLMDLKNLNQGFDAQEETYVDMMKAGIIDPAKVVRTALQDAGSVAALLITAEAMIADAPKKETPTAVADGGGMGGY